MLSSNTLGESNSLRHLIFLSFTSYFGEVSILGYQLSMYGLVMVYKIRFHKAHNDTYEVRQGIGIPKDSVPRNGLDSFSLSNLGFWFTSINLILVLYA
jgi:hypothetical protein